MSCLFFRVVLVESVFGCAPIDNAEDDRQTRVDGGNFVHVPSRRTSSDWVSPPLRVLCFLQLAFCHIMSDFTFSWNTRSSHSSDTHRLDMKDVTSNRHSRHTLVYPKKRPSPHGVTKAHKSPLLPLNGVARRTPRHPKAALLQQQRQREAQIQALRREGIFIEDEYMDEIHRYMLEMEVR